MATDGTNRQMCPTSYSLFLSICTNLYLVRICMCKIQFLSWRISLSSMTLNVLTILKAIASCGFFLHIGVIHLVRSHEAGQGVQQSIHHAHKGGGSHMQMRTPKWTCFSRVL